jgi:hypothetical protein
MFISSLLFPVVLTLSANAAGISLSLSHRRCQLPSQVSSMPSRYHVFWTGSLSMIILRVSIAFRIFRVPSFHSLHIVDFRLSVFTASFFTFFDPFHRILFPICVGHLLRSRRLYWRATTNIILTGLVPVVLCPIPLNQTVFLWQEAGFLISLQTFYRFVHFAVLLHR